MSGGLTSELRRQETNKRVGDGGEGDATYDAKEMDAWTWGTGTPSSPPICEVHIIDLNQSIHRLTS